MGSRTGATFKCPTRKWVTAPTENSHEHTGTTHTAWLRAIL